MNVEVPFELQALTNAVKYQRWIFQSIEPYLGKRILEVGSGIGNMSRWLPRRERLILSENDPKLFSILKKTKDFQNDPCVSLMELDLTATSEIEKLAHENLDTIISFNVLEHIEDDQAALAALSKILLDGKGEFPRRIVTFIPAHDWAYGALDKEFKHYRRYSRRRWQELQKAVAPTATLTCRYFNIVGLLGWIANGKVMRKTTISDRSLALFEKICPMIRPVDYVMHNLLRVPAGQSLIAVLEFNRPAEQ
jgi:SAM-dependent methyltransferase